MSTIKAKIYWFAVFVLLAVSIQLGAQELSQSDINEISRLEKEIEGYASNNEKNKMAANLSRIAYIYWNNLQWKDALAKFKEVLPLFEELKNNNACLQINRNIGLIYYDIEEYTKSVPYLEKALVLSKQLNRTIENANILINLASSLEYLNRFPESIDMANHALEKAKELNDIKLIKRCYGILSETHKKNGDTEKSFEYFNLYSSMDHQLNKEEIQKINQEAKTQVNKAIAEKEASQTELRQVEDSLQMAELINRKRKAEIAFLESEKRAQEAEIEKQQAKLRVEEIIRNSLIAGIALILVFSILLYREVTQKKRANRLLALQNEEIKKQKEEIQEQSKHIQGSIRYAQTIQGAILQPEENIKKLFDTFILFRPKEIVSGDFYWFTHIKAKGSSDGDKVLVSVVDCTGHGVPGAFMSMIGNTHLNEIVNKKHVYQPDDILKTLDDEVYYSLNQDTTDNFDGMDVCFCLLENHGEEKVKVSFCGAKRPLIYWLKETNEIKTLKGVRKSIAGGNLSRNNPHVFKNEEVILSVGDRIFLSSDGIIDQNSPTCIRFGSKKFNQILLQTADKALSEQKNLLIKELESFQQNEEQRDDITVIGLEISSL